MNPILEKNLNSLKEYDQFMKEYFENPTTDSANSDFELQVGVELIEKRKVLYVVKEGKQYQLDSLYNSVELVNKWFANLNHVTYRSRYLLFGLGNGMFVTKLLEEVGEEAIILVVEPSKAIFCTVMKEFDISHILSDRRVILTVSGISKNEIGELLNSTLGYDDFAGVVERNYLNYKKVFEKEFEKYERTLNKHSDRIKSNEILVYHVGQAQFDNSMANVAYLAKGKSLATLKKSLPKGIPGIIVAAGPSLDKNIMDLKLAKNKAFIIAVDSSVNALLKAGILPDIMITCDALKSGKYFLDSEVKKIPLITRVTGSRKLTVPHTGDKYFLNLDDSYVKEIFGRLQEELPLIASGGCVATDAYGVLEYLQFETIIIIGQDLAYDNDRNYAQGTLLEDMKMDITSKDVLQVEGINGEMLNTEIGYCIFLDWYEKKIAANPKIHVIDATEGGAKINGTTIMTLKDAIAKYCKREVDITSILKDLPEQLTKEKQEQVLEHFRQIPDKFKLVQKDAEKLIRDYEKIWKLVKLKKSTANELKKLLQKARDKALYIEKQTIFFYVDSIIQKRVRKELGNNFFAEVEGESDIETSIKQALGYFKIMKEEMERVIPLGEEWVRAIADEDLRQELSAENR